jgi:hypothetical protein
MMGEEFIKLLEEIERHFTAGELVEFLGLDITKLFDCDTVTDVIVERLEDIKEEIGLD